MRKYLIVILALLLCSCEKEDTTYSNVLVENLTQHHINIIPYTNGMIDSNRIFSLSYAQEKSIESHTDMGISSGPIYFGDYFYGVDSIIVIWDNTYPVTHMISDSFISNNKYIPAFHNRNIGYLGKYEIRKVKESKHNIIWTATYSFTEADYEYAKE